MKKAILLLIIIFLSCKNTENSNQSTLLKNENSNLISEIKDSLFVGEPLISDRKFIEEIFIGRENSNVLLKYESILNKRNSFFLNKKTKVYTVNVQGNPNLTLELTDRFSKNSHIILYTKINNVLKDSTTILKNEQKKGKKLGMLYFLENDLTLWKLETFAIKNENETYIGIKHWTKHKINSATGKIDFIEELNPASGVNEESYEGNEDEENISQNKEINYSFNTLKGDWSVNCKNMTAIQINDEELVITVIPDQYYLHLSKIDKKNDIAVFKYKLKSMEGLEAQHEYSKEYFNDSEIAIIKIINNNTIEFNWLGFYNKSNKQRQSTQPHIGNENPIILKRCEY